MCTAYDGRHGQQTEGVVDIRKSSPTLHVLDAVLSKFYHNCKLLLQLNN